MARSKKGVNRHKRVLLTTHPRTPSNVPSRWQRRKFNRTHYKPVCRNPVSFPCSAKLGVCHILALPREIRNIIYDMVIEDLNPIVDRTGPGRARVEYQGLQTLTFYRTRLRNINTAGLLCSNRQVREETIEAINSKNTTSDRGICYSLGLIEHASCLDAAWLARPAPPQFVQSVEVYFETSLSGSTQWTDAWDTRISGQLPQLLLQMLRRFLDYGPRFKPRTAESVRKAEIADALPLKSLTVILVPTEMRCRTDSATGRVLWMRRTQQYINPADDPMDVAHQNLGRWMAKLAKSEILYGSVQRLRHQYQDTLQEWEILDTGKQIEAAKEMSLLGWGPVLGLTQMALHSGRIKYTKHLDCLPLTPEQEEWHKENVNCSEEICTMPEFADRPPWQYMYEEV